MFRSVMQWRRAACLTAIVALLLAGGCTGSGPDPMSRNSGVNLTTRPDQSLRTSMFIGKWDINGKRTNLANGNSGLGAAPDNFWKDLTGKGWRFEEGGILWTKATFGSDKGHWRLKGKHELVIQEFGAPTEVTYEAMFRDGYLYLKRPTGGWLVFERDKFLGL
ncbi:MAG: hypothetical protein GC159_23245 [Phycisphaera sp.]|nr:hypothetical protein [Phycisphaera sp.]